MKENYENYNNSGTLNNNQFQQTSNSQNPSLQHNINLEGSQRDFNNNIMTPKSDESQNYNSGIQSKNKLNTPLNAKENLNTNYQSKINSATPKTNSNYKGQTQNINRNNNNLYNFNKDSIEQERKSNQMTSNTNFSQKDNHKRKEQPNISRLDAHGYEHKIQDLLELVEIQENKINNQHENKMKLVSKLKEVEDDNIKYQGKINKLNDDRLNQGKEIVDLSQKLLDVNNKYQVVSTFILIILAFRAC